MSHQRLPKALLEWGCMCEAAEGKVLQDLESMAADRAQLALAISVLTLCCLMKTMMMMTMMMMTMMMMV